MTNETLNRCREEFEAWWKDNTLLPKTGTALDRTEEDYYSFVTQNCWLAWQAARARCEMLLTKEQWADRILADFQTENHRTKADEWEAAYAHLFKQLQEVCGQKRESNEEVTMAYLLKIIGDHIVEEAKKGKMVCWEDGLRAIRKHCKITSIEVGQS